MRRTIDEAKIYLSIQVELKHRLGKDFEAECSQLGLEALKEIEHLRRSQVLHEDELLPSETKAQVAESSSIAQ